MSDHQNDLFPDLNRKPKPKAADIPFAGEMHAAPHFDGPSYEAKHDHARLTGQLKRIRDYMLGAGWKTLGEIEAATGDPQSSISAQLRHLRKKKFGSYVVDKRRRGKESSGLYEYHVSEGKV